MARTTSYENWYVLDDATLIGNFVDTEWSVSPRILVKPKFKFTPDTDKDSFDYSTGDMLCSITSDDENNEPRGIGFDGYMYERTVKLRLRCMSKEKLIIAQDEIDRILARHAIRPSKDWHLLIKKGSAPIYPFRKFYQLDVVYTLKCYWKPRYKPTTE